MAMSTTIAPADAPQASAASPAAGADSDWTGLYRTGGDEDAGVEHHEHDLEDGRDAAGLPSDVVEWFALFQRNGLLGLLAFELLMVVYVILSVPVAIALSVALWRTSPVLTALYAALSLVGITAFIAARPAFEMLALSEGYAAATTAAQRATFLAAGQAILSVFQGTAFQVSYVLGSISGLIISAAMLRSTLFSKATAYLRIASSVLDVGLFLPTIGLVISLFSVLCLLVFNLLIARRLLQLGRKVSESAAKDAPG